MIKIKKKNKQYTFFNKQIKKIEYLKKDKKNGKQSNAGS